ncbi:MAG: sigma 54-interacting transcriptional regulator, partial [Myxococcota bacterium]
PEEPEPLHQIARPIRAAAAGERGDLETARSHVEAVRSEAASGSFFEADAFTALADIYDRQGMVAEASKLRSAAQTTWDRVAGFLPEEYRQAYRDHPRRRPVYRASPPLPERSPVAVEKARLGRFFAVNRKLNSTLRLDRVLEYAVDAAIELTAAERGFVLLEGAGEGGELTVASARNLDRERLPRSHLKFSRSIAERVVASGEPVSTVNARDDARFRDERSVHAMRLQSVASVPIRGREGIIGALYLDNRFEQGRFEPEDIELLQAFADQVAMAIDNAELHAELRRRSAALEAAQEELRALVAGQAQQIENLTAEVEARQSVLEYRYDYSHIIGRSAPMRRVLEVLDRVIASDLTVLVQGETGTGKELIARAIHYNSKRREGPMVSLNCAALPENLIEAELFGHEKGAFTGADVARRGLLVAAEGGTVFLDELGEMPLNVQAKLLRALQEREVWPLGASRPLPVDLRLVAATHRRLRESVAEGTFREDLFYRVSVVGIDLPPLRERREDIPELIAFFLEQAEPPKNLSVAARRALIAHPWPGNVRELENVLRRAAVLATGSTIDVADLDLGAAPSSVPRHRGEFREKEADRILQALDACGWNVSQVSRDLGIPRQTLYRKLRRYRIERPDG